MAEPAEIDPDDLLNIEPVTAWFDWFKAGRGIKRDTFANLRTAAATEPTTAMICYATDDKLILFYTGDTDTGDNGFLTLGGGTW